MYMHTCTPWGRRKERRKEGRNRKEKDGRKGRMDGMNVGRKEGRKGRRPKGLKSKDNELRRTTKMRSKGESRKKAT